MYDAVLREEVKNFKIGAHTIDDLKYRYENIEKIIKNRTREKISFLQSILEQNIIDIDLYNELLDRVKSDYNDSFHYLYGWRTI